MRLHKLVFAAPLLVGGCASPVPQTDWDRMGVDEAEYRRVKHDVTAQMEIETKAQTNRLAPAFSRRDTYGKAIAVGKGPKPQFVIFVKRGCPCSIDAQVLFNKLARRYEDKVEFVGVIDKESQEFATQFKSAFPIVDEPSKGLMKAYDARASVYSALVARNGHIVKMWPGYSAAWLKEMNSMMAKASATPEKPFDPEFAPKEKLSGCPF